MSKNTESIQLQHGSVAVEFALVASLFLILMIGALEWGRVLMQINTVGEITQLLSRTLAVCDLGSINIPSRAQQWMPGLPSDLLEVIYQPTGCDASTCQWVTVQTHSATHLEILNPFSSLELTWPRISSTVVRESMSSFSNGVPNPICLS